MDIFHLGRKLYLAIVDYTTNFFDISQLPDKLSSKVVIHEKHPFPKYGIPKVVISENGPELQQIYSKLSPNNGILNIPPRVRATPKVMNKSKELFKQLRKASKKH